MAGPWCISVGKSTYRRLSAELGRFFARRINDGTDPNELTTEVWISAGRYYAKRAPVRHYLFYIARSILAEHKRKQQRRVSLVALEEVGSAVDLPDDSPGNETLQILRSNCELIWGAIEEVREPYREVLRLWLDGLDSVQIANDLDLHHNTARSRLSRGRRQLAEAVRAQLALTEQPG